MKTLNKSQQQPRGFALICSISIASLLVLVALAILSLSVIETKLTQQEKALKEAQANARMALMMAIGQLQDLSGQDTRVSASSRLISENNVATTGVWRRLGRNRP